MKKALITGITGQDGSYLAELLLEKGYEIVHGSDLKPETFCREVADCEAVLLRTMPCPEALLAAGKKLKIVARHGVGYDNVDIAAAEKLGIWVTNTPQALSDSVAEFTLAAMLAESGSSVA